MKCKYAIKLVGILLICSLLTGCWDSLEIDKRGFVHVMGVDVDVSEQEAAQPFQGEEASLSEVIFGEKHPRFVTTYALSKYTGENGGEGSMVISTTGESNFINRYQLTSKMAAEPFLGHLKVILLGEEVLKNEDMLRFFLDSIERDPLISRKVAFGVVQGRAVDAMHVKLEASENTGQFISELMGGISQMSRVPTIDFNQLMISLHESRNGVLPKITYSQDEIKVGGSAVIKDLQFAGWLSDIQTLAFNIIINRVNQYDIYTTIGGRPIPLAVTGSSSKMKLLQGNGSLSMQIIIQVEAYVEEYYFESGDNLTSLDIVNEIESQGAFALKRLTENVIEVLQKDMGADVLGMGGFIKKYHPGVWKQIENDWEQIFTDMDVEILSEVQLRRIGLSR